MASYYSAYSSAVKASYTLPAKFGYFVAGEAICRACEARGAPATLCSAITSASTAAPASGDASPARFAACWTARALVACVRQ